MQAAADRWSHALRTYRAAALFVALLSTACHEWRTEYETPQALLATSHPERLRVTRSDGSHVVL